MTRRAARVLSAAALAAGIFPVARSAPPAAPAPGATARVAASAPAADLIITNARVFTADRGHPDCEAVAVLGERIVAAGGRAEIDGWRGPTTRVIDAGGRRVVPGVNDAHRHFVSGGMDPDKNDPKKASKRKDVVEGKRG